LEIAGIHKLEEILGTNLFDYFPIAPKKEKLLNEGLIKFQAQLDFENIKNTGFYNPKKSGTVLINWNVSVTDSGFLVQIQDIRDGKQAEESLQSEEKYSRWFEDDLTGDFIAKPEGKIIECNPAFVEIYGFNNRENAVKSDISKFNMVDWFNLIARLRRERKIQGYQTWHRRPDGKEIHVVANVVGIFNDSDVLTQVKGYIFDDTERKIAEESLQESEEKYHRLFDEDLTGDFIATLEGEILECNPAFAEIYGFDDCEMALKCNISQFNPFDWPYMVTRLKRECKIYGYQSWQRRSDGMRIHVVANVVGIFNDSDELIQVKGYVFDDTERKKTEEELYRSKSQMKEILDSIKDGFVALSPYWNFIYVNQCAAEYFGVEADDLIGQNLWKRFPELIGTTYENALRKAMETQEIQHFEASGIPLSKHCFDFSIYPSIDGISAFWRKTECKKLEKE
jgi:PAS domain S-box-containing protein